MEWINRIIDLYSSELQLTFRQLFVLEMSSQFATNDELAAWVMWSNCSNIAPGSSARCYWEFFKADLCWRSLSENQVWVLESIIQTKNFRQVQWCFKFAKSSANKATKLLPYYDQFFRMISMLDLLSLSSVLSYNSLEYEMAMV